MLKQQIESVKAKLAEPKVREFMQAVAFNVAVSLTAAVLVAGVKRAYSATSEYVSEKLADNVEIIETPEA